MQRKLKRLDNNQELKTIWEMKIMNELTHDPSEYIRGLQQLLVSDKKKIAFLFGAGTSLAKKNEDSKNIPAIDKMTVNWLQIVAS